jgi:hypothetical protein
MQAMIENRTSQRQRTLKGARIVLPNGNSTIDCTVRNLSERGAKLQVTSIIGIPDAFQLLLPNAPRRACQVIWRKANELGVAFLDG